MVTHTVPVGTGPRAIAITPDGRTAVVANQGGNTVSIIDVESGTVTHTVTVGTKPADVAVSPDGATAYIAVEGILDNSSSSGLRWVDLATGVITCSTLPMSFPTRVTVSPDGLFLYVYSGALGSVVAKVRESDGAVTAEYFFGTSVGSLALSPDGEHLVVSSVVGSSIGIGIVRTSTMDPVQTMAKTFVGGRSTYSTDGRSIYITDKFQNEVVVIDTTTYAMTRWSSGGREPFGLVAASSGDIFVSNEASGTLARLISASSRITVDVVDPKDPTLTETQDRVLVPSGSGNALGIINTSSMQRELVQVGTSPIHVATARGYAVVSNNGSNTVSIIRLAVLPASGDQVPTAPLQQFGRIEAHVCGADIPDSVLFPGVGQDQRADGWSMSWAQWPNGGTGGFVCTRQPYYTSTGTWSAG